MPEYGDRHWLAIGTYWKEVTAALFGSSNTVGYVSDGSRNQPLKGSKHIYYHYPNEYTSIDFFTGCGPYRSTGYSEPPYGPGIYYSHTQKASFSIVRSSSYL